MKREEFKAWAIAHGFKEDRWGHLQKVYSDQVKVRRFKLGKLGVRFEAKVLHGDGSSSWVRLRSGYYKDLSIGNDGKLRGLKR